MDLSNPKILKGGVFTDERGELLYNNEFDLSMIKGCTQLNILIKV